MLPKSPIAFCAPIPFRDNGPVAQLVCFLLQLSLFHSDSRSYSFSLSLARSSIPSLPPSLSLSPLVSILCVFFLFFFFVYLSRPSLSEQEEPGESHRLLRTWTVDLDLDLDRGQGPGRGPCLNDRDLKLILDLHPNESERSSPPPVLRPPTRPTAIGNSQGTTHTRHPPTDLDPLLTSPYRTYLDYTH